MFGIWIMIDNVFRLKVINRRLEGNYIKNKDKINIKFYIFNYILKCVYL